MSAMSDVGVDYQGGYSPLSGRRLPVTIVTTTRQCPGRGTKIQCVTSLVAAIAAPTIPAVFCRVAATTGVRVLSTGTHLSAFRLMPPPAMNNSGDIAFSIATSTLVTCFVHFL